MVGGVELFRVAARATVEETKAVLVATAKRELARVKATDPKPTRIIRTVDGVTGAPEEAVRPDGRIVYDFPRLDEIVQAAMETLFELSPVLSGEYRNAHTLFVNGVQARNLEAWDGTGEVVISNPLPYSRVIEAGKMKMRVPGTDHVYEQAEMDLRARFGNQARIKFIYRGIVSGAMPDPMAFAPALKRRKKNGRFTESGGHAHNKAFNRYPALEIEALR